MLSITFPENLPVSARRDEIADSIAAHQVVIVCGETGSGKTTQLPKIALSLGLKLDQGVNVGVYSALDRLVVSGVVWPDAREQRARKAFLIHQPMGEGHIVAFAEEPNFRGYTEATELLFMNAVLLGPAH